MPMKIERRFRSLLVKRIAAERDIPVGDVSVIEVRQFPTGRNRWGDTGEIEVNYAPGQPWRAIYGFDSLANVKIYLD